MTEYSVVHFYLLDSGFYILSAIGVNSYNVIIFIFLLPHLHSVISVTMSVIAAGYFPTLVFMGTIIIFVITQLINYSDETDAMTVL